MLAKLQGTADTHGYVGKVPVRNLWLLMFYASDLFRQLEQSQDVSAEERPDDLPDLAARILCRQVEKRIKRGFALSYQVRHEPLPRARGRIDLFTTNRQMLLEKGRVSCRYEALTVNTARNCFVRIALESVACLVNSRSLSKECKTLAQTMKRMGITGPMPDSKHAVLRGIGYQELLDRQMIAAAQFVFDLQLPTEFEGEHVVSSPERQENLVRRLFEKGIAGFYAVALAKHGWQIDVGKRLLWQVDQASAGMAQWFPGMKTDIILSHACSKRRIVIDTKFTNIVQKGWYRENSLHNKHIYQIYAYLMSQVCESDPLSKHTSGLLLHPAIERDVDEFVNIQGHQIRFATVDLSGEASKIKAQLLARVLEPPRLGCEADSKED